MEKTYIIPKFWWLWVPVLFFAFQLIIEFTLNGQTLSALHSENGPHESLQFILLTLGFCLSVNIIFKMDAAQRKSPLMGWIILAALGCFYVAGEEISWGQHIIDWATPEFWNALNDQGETNLHNTTSWLDQKPRLIMEIGVIIGGLIIPFLKWKKPSLVPARFETIYPPAILAVTAAFATGVKIIEKTGEALLDDPLFARASEVQELYFFYFVLLYLLCLRGRVLLQKQS